MACVFALTSLTALAQHEKYEVLICTNSGKKLWIEQNNILFCGIDDKKFTIDQLYMNGYRLVSSYTVIDTNSSPQRAAFSFIFEKKK